MPDTTPLLSTRFPVCSRSSCPNPPIPPPFSSAWRFRGLHNAHYIVPFVADLVQDRTTEVSLLHVLEDDETAEDIRETVLRPAAEQMAARGIDGGLLALDTMAGDDPDGAIVEAAERHDAVVIGESEPSVRDILFGTVPETIAQTAHCPVLVVRNPDEDLDAAEPSTREEA
jgi:nucleotide-binding universal stress UspA family protein